jgi:hypothetical protein
MMMSPFSDSSLKQQSACRHVPSLRHIIQILSQPGEFRGIQYSASVANVIDDMNLKPNATWHPKIKDVVYFGMFM